MPKSLAMEFLGRSYQNPLLPASGCYANCHEAEAWVDLGKAWGGLVSKSVSLEPRAGNPGHRVAEAPAGLLNSIGLQNPGLTAFLAEHIEFLLAANPNLIVNIAGSSTAEYLQLVEALNPYDLAAIEVNLSCPNVSTGCMSIGTDPKQVEALLKELSQVSRHPLIAKLTPNVAAIEPIAKAAEAGGAKALTVVNTFLGMAIDIKTRRPIFRRNTAGYSGPGIQPLALRLAAEACRAVQIPVIGVGGISRAEDVLAFIIAGCSLVQIGAAVLCDPLISEALQKDLLLALDELKIQNLAELKGSLKWYEN
ncbi:MAG: dihydroorotate dehydrogenase [Eubacteriales bacterium]|nr:dihydroorotate dehydrogenase [Eubacteriales bacterium]